MEVDKTKINGNAQVGDLVYHNEMYGIIVGYKNNRAHIYFREYDSTQWDEPHLQDKQVELIKELTEEEKEILKEIQQIYMKNKVIKELIESGKFK